VREEEEDDGERCRGGDEEEEYGLFERSWEEGFTSLTSICPTIPPNI